MQYFKHYANMSNDTKIRRLIRQYGADGYAIYNYVLERITDKLTTESPIPEMEDNSEDIAYVFNIDTLRVNDILHWCINQGLFEISEINGYIMCHKIYQYFDKSQTSSQAIRNMINEYKIIKSQKISGKSGIDLKNRTEQNRTEHIVNHHNDTKLNDIIKHWNSVGSLPTHKEQTVITQLKGNAKAKDVIQNEELHDIIKAIDRYSEILTSKKYYFSYEWKLWQFLQRGYYSFDSDSAYKNYVASNYKEEPKTGILY